MGWEGWCEAKLFCWRRQWLETMVSWPHTPTPAHVKNPVSFGGWKLRWNSTALCILSSVAVQCKYFRIKVTLKLLLMCSLVSNFFFIREATMLFQTHLELFDMIRGWSSCATSCSIRKCKGMLWYRKSRNSSKLCRGKLCSVCLLLT